MKVRYLRCDGTSVWKDVEDWGEEIRLRCLEREITFVTLHGPIQAFGKLAEDLLSIGDGLGPTGFRQTLQRRFAAVEGSNEICGFDRLIIDRKSGVEGKSVAVSVYLGGGRIIK